MKPFQNKISAITILSIIFCLFNNSVLAQQLSLKWAQQLGQSGWDYIKEIKQVSDSNYLLVGSLKGNLSVDSLNEITKNSSNAWISSIDTNGNILWQKTFGGKEFETVTSIAELSQNTLITGIFQDSIWFDSLLLIAPSYTGGFIASINQQGERLSLKSIGGKATIKNIKASNSNSGTCYIAGSFSDSLFLAGNLQSSLGDNGIFLTRYQPDGTELYPVIFRTLGSVSLGGVDVNDSLVCIAGSFSDTLRVGDTSLIPVGFEDIFIAMFNHTGQMKWIVSAGGSDKIQISGIVLTDNNEIGLTGSFSGSVLFGQQIAQSSGGQDVFITLLNPEGGFRWVKSIGGISGDYGYSIDVNNSNEFFASGSFVHIIGIPDENGNIVELESFSPFGNAFIAKYDEDGILKASYNLPGTSEDFCQSLIVQQNGIITTAGNFYETISLEGSNGFSSQLTSAGEKDVFILSFEDMCLDFSADAGADTIICPGQSIYLTTSQNYSSYQWLPGGLVNHDLEIIEPGTYLLTATNSYGCIASDSIYVDLAMLPTVFAGNDTTIMAGETLNLTNSTVAESDFWIWTSDGTGYFSNCNDQQTSYTVSNTDIANGSVTLIFIGTNMCASVSDSLNVVIPMDDDGVLAYPNPTSGIVTLVCEDDLVIQTVTIARQSGNILEYELPVNNTEYSYNLQNQPPGTYLFYITTNTGTTSKTVNKI